MKLRQMIEAATQVLPICPATGRVCEVTACNGKLCAQTRINETRTKLSEEFQHE